MSKKCIKPLSYNGDPLERGWMARLSAAVFLLAVFPVVMVAAISAERAREKQVKGNLLNQRKRNVR